LLPGFGGHLISEAFLEEALRTIDGDGRHAAERFRGELIQWRRRCAILGPAASVRTILHVGATPLFVALGFDAPIQIEPADHRLAASDRHAAGVCRSLKDGVLSASADLLGALVARPLLGEGGIGDSFEQALTIVYRMLFLLFAEARSLVPLWHPVYRHSYSVEALRGCAELAEPASGLWDALRAIARLAHTGCRAGDLHVMPFNGRLFSPSRTPLAERRGLDDEAARRAILSLSTQPTPDRAGRHPIAYRDLGVEQLGAVYVTLL